MTAKQHFWAFVVSALLASSSGLMLGHYSSRAAALLDAAYAGDISAREQARVQRTLGDVWSVALLVAGLIAIVFLVAFIRTRRRATTSQIKTAT